MRPTFALALISSVLVAGTVRAGGPSPELARLQAAHGHSLKWNFTPRGQTARWGHSEVLVQAPVAYAREQALDFAHYKELAAGKFKTARVVDKRNGSTDLYVQVPVMHGMVMLWFVLRFAPLRTVAPGVQVLEGKLVKGNVKKADFFITLREVDATRTIVESDLLITPEMIAPEAAVDEELRDAAQNAVDAVQLRAEAKYAPLRPATPQPPPQDIASADDRDGGS